jgi:VWFA-related protein
LHAIFAHVLVLAANQAPPQPAVATFKTGVELVVVPVVVRDLKGRAVGNLTQQDFQLCDKGKLQTISRFSVQKTGEDSSAAPVEHNPTTTTATPSKPAATLAPSIQPGAEPVRFIAYFFDDVHLSFNDLKLISDATIQHVQKALKPTDRVSIVSTSGINNLDFTDDREKIIHALSDLHSKTRARKVTGCPPMTGYMADLIVNQGDKQALDVAKADVMACVGVPMLPQAAEAMARVVAEAAADNELGLGESDAVKTLATLKNLVQSMASAPGQRSVVMATPGFQVSSILRPLITDVMDRAIRAHVTVSALSSRGVAAPALIDVTQPWNEYRTPGPRKGISSSIAKDIKYNYVLANMAEDDSALTEIADSTGGTFVRNMNDLEGGLRRIDEPEYIYMLGFSPRDLKYDGSFHSLTIKLKPHDLTMQARRGYYAPDHPSNLAERADHEIREAFFSRDSVQQFPVSLYSVVEKSSVQVILHIDTRPLEFRPNRGRSDDIITVAYGLFDQNGKLVHSMTQNVAMHLLPATLAAAAEHGLTLRVNFEAQPGHYSLRVVARDFEGEMMSSGSSAIEVN